MLASNLISQTTWLKVKLKLENFCQAKTSLSNNPISLTTWRVVNPLTCKLNL